MSYGIVGASYVREEQPYVVLSLRDADGKRILQRIPFLPYFFCKEIDFDKVKGFMGLDTRFIKFVQHGFTGVDGHKLLKITMKDPSNVGNINKKLEGTGIELYESNILFPYRFLLDKGLKTGVKLDDMSPVEVESRHKFVYIDIEALADKAPDERHDEIIIIGLYDPILKQYHTIFKGRKFDIAPDILKTEPREVFQYPCNNEEEIFSTFAQVWVKLQPDAVVSFSPFDMDYLAKRMNMIGISVDFLSPIYNISWRKNVHISCVHVVDYSELYRKVLGEPVWNTLDFIAKKELGYGKFPIDKIVPTFRANYRKMVEYNLRDVEILKDLEDKTNLIKDYLMLIWSETGLDLADCLIPNRVGDMMHIRHLRGEYIFKSVSNVQGMAYLGALVLCEHTGDFKNVAVLDWNELYPTIMECFHVSLDTLDLTGDIIIAKDMRFTSSRPGWTNEILRSARSKRLLIKHDISIEIDPVKKKRLKLLSAAIKAIINAEYGLYGQKTKTFTSRFYDPRIAGAITYVGRDILEHVRDFLKKIDYELIYADTDSLFIPLKTDDPNETEIIKSKIHSYINSYLYGRYKVESKFSLSLEYIFSALLIIAKKRYHGITTTGETVIKGLNIVRKDTANITVIEQQKVGEMRLKGVPISEVKKYVMNLYAKVSRGNVSIEDIAVKGKCTKEYYSTATRNAKAIQYAKKKKIEIGVDERFYWVYIFPKEQFIVETEVRIDGEVPKFVKKKETMISNVIGFLDPKDIPKDIVIDYKKMADYTIMKPLKKYIMEEKIINQQSLSNYW